MTRKTARFPITLITDFGLADTFVGQMKGVLHSKIRNPEIVDITHEILPQDIHGAVRALSESWHWFPEGTVHVVVVDPGVGSDRKILVVEASGHRFLVPDNGVISALPPSAITQVRALEKVALFEVSATFHGRDRFAPAAAALACGAPFESLGREVDKSRIRRVRIQAPKDVAGGLEGRVEHADRFGNLMTNVRKEDLSRMERPVVRVEERVLPVGKTYAEVEDGAWVAVINSAGRLEIAIRNGSAERALEGRDVRVFVRDDDGRDTGNTKSG